MSHHRIWLNMSDSDNNRDSIASMATISGNPTAENSDGKIKGAYTIHFHRHFGSTTRAFIGLCFSVDILLNATGNVPIMKKRKWTVDQEKQISWIIRFIHKYLKLEPEEKLVNIKFTFPNWPYASTIRDSIVFSSFMWIRHLHRRRTKPSRICTNATAPMANWSYTIARVRRGDSAASQ